MLSQKALKEFKQIWKEEFNEKISDELATEEAINLLTMFNAIYRPLKKEWLKEDKYDNKTNLQNKRENLNLG